MTESSNPTLDQDTSNDETDPHAPKALRPEPTRERSGGRTLRKGPVLAAVLGAAGIVLIAVAVALRASSSAPDGPKPGTDPSGAPQPPVIPEAFRNPERTPPRAADLARSPDAGVTPTPMHRMRPGGSPGGREIPAMRANANRQRRLEQDEKAMSAGILFDLPNRDGASQGPATAPSFPLPALSAFAAHMGAPPPGSTSSPFGLDADPNRQDRKNAFLDTEGGAKTTDRLVTTLQHPVSPYEIQAGTILPAVLVTGINSDLPGPVIGQIRENVYDTVSGNYLLIPQGSRLLATYDSMVAWGQERVLLCWNRLLFPNGDSINLQCMPAADLSGAAGLTDSVNEHWWRIVKGAAVASLLAATSQAAAGNTQGVNPTVPQMWAGGAAGQINQVGQQITRRNIDIQPTITIRPGWSLNVIVTKDMVVPPYRTPGGPASIHP